MPSATSEFQRQRRARGLEFQGEVIAALRRVPGAWVYRLPDHGNESPFDVLALLPWAVVGVEVKLVRSRISLSALRPNQVRGLLELEASQLCAQDVDLDTYRRIGVLVVGFDADGGREVYVARASVLLDYMKKRGVTSLAADGLRSAPWVERVFKDHDGWDIGSALRRAFFW